MTKSGLTKKEWRNDQPYAQKIADDKRVSRYPHELTANADGSICTRVKPNTGSHRPSEPEANEGSLR